MRRRDDYSDEMFTKRLSDEDIETLLSGGEPVDASLSEVARALSALDSSRFKTPSDTKSTEFARRAAALARAGESAQLAATARPRRGLSLTPRLATAAVAASLLFAMTGVAVAADDSAPGDALYGIDRALEQIGIGNGAASERIQEANALAAKGQSVEALNHLATSLEKDSDQAAVALLRASERMSAEGHPGSDNSQEVRSKVAEMIEWIATTDFTGKEFGQGVADRARDLGNQGQGQGQGNRDEAGEGNRGQGNGNRGQGNGNSGQGNGNRGQGNGNSGTPPGQSEDKPGNKDK